jgi:pyruvate kinase
LPAHFRSTMQFGHIGVVDAVSLNAVESAKVLNARFILTCTQGRATPCLLSRFRPDCWILTHGGDEKTNNLMGLPYGVHPVDLDGATDGLVNKTIQQLITAGMVEKNDSVIWVEDKLPDDRLETVSVKFIKT